VPPVPVVPATAATASDGGPGAELPPPLRTPRGGQGQWGAGHTEPLNPNERTKKDDDGLNVRARIETTYALQGFDSIDPGDLRGRMRWWGLYTQRREGIPGGLTATLEPEELDAEFFMLRVRIPGGQLSNAQLRAVAEVGTTFCRDTADITDRQNVQFHWVRIEDVPAIWQRLEAVGLSTAEACGDTPRNMLGCPLAGVDGDEVIDATPALLATNARFTGDPAFSNLPRKFKTSISGCPSQCTLHELHDVAFVGVVHPELGPGFDLWVGGGLSTNPMIGKRLGAFVPAARVEEVWAGVAGVFRDWGYRRARTRARIKFLVADWGPERFRAVLERDYLPGGPLPDGPPPAPPRAGHRDHVGVLPQHDGLVAVGAAPTVGRVSGSLLLAVADLAASYGDGRVRLTVEQKLVLLGVPPHRSDALVAALGDLGLAVRPSEFRRGTMACTGLEFCKLAITETKGRAQQLVEELEKRLPLMVEPFSINMNGCPNSCARTQVADVGLKGMQVTTEDGRRVEGFQVHLGGHLAGVGAAEATLGRKVRGLRVASDDLPDYVEGLVRRWLDGRAQGQSFADWSAAADPQLLVAGATRLAGGAERDE